MFVTRKDLAQVTDTYTQLRETPKPQPGLASARERYAMGTILIAEDDETARRFLVALVERLGHEAIPCTNGREALDAIVGGRKADMLITDYSMPEMNGLALTDRLRAEPATRGLPILIISGFLGVKSISDVLAHGVNALMIKPLELKPLREYIEGFVGVAQKSPAIGKQPHRPDAGSAEDQTVSGSELSLS
jgi:CheY-like chemotaxis protein